ncbi:hypothetical protein EIP86_002570 [Pleurotus ostreatoroseus]|nr:hypothetical protein EIP86_002570 [Pleurotus ostreatoroseus]
MTDIVKLALPCTVDGIPFVAEHPSLPVHSNGQDNGWAPFGDGPTFKFAELAYKKAELSGGNIDELLDVWCEYNLLHGGDDSPFRNKEELYNTIDSIQHGDAPWESFGLRYTGPTDDNSPTWKRTTYIVHCRNTETVAHNMLKNEEFKEFFDYVPFEEYDASGARRYSNLMSGKWAYRKSTQIAQDPSTHGSMLVPIVSGADKTTVSVATGQNDFHPLYMSIGNVHNAARRAHRDAVIPIAFLAIPKAPREEENSLEFRTFQKQLYHASIARIYAPLRKAMATPEVVQCPDGHYRRAIYELGPFIADYPEQVVLAGIVQGWCPKCLATPEDLEQGCGEPRCRTHTQYLVRNFEGDFIWTAWGIDAAVEVM